MSKCQCYLLAIANLINQYSPIKCHFLSISGITSEFLAGCRPSVPDSSIGTLKVRKQLLKIAVWDFYQVFDLNKYLDYGCASDIEKVVWAKFRKLYKEWYIIKQIAYYKRNGLL